MSSAHVVCKNCVSAGHACVIYKRSPTVQSIPLAIEMLEECCAHDTIMTTQVGATLEMVNPEQRRVEYLDPQPVARRKLGS